MFLELLHAIEFMQAKKKLTLKEQDFLEEKRDHLATFLDASTQYDKVHILNRCQEMGLHEEALSLYKKLSCHREVLETLILKMEDQTQEAVFIVFIYHAVVFTDNNLCTKFVILCDSLFF